MIDRVDLQAESLIQPLLQMRMLGIDIAGHDADRRSAIDLLEPIQNRPQKSFPLFVAAHVVDRQNDDGLDPILAHPLRGDQLREIAVNIIWIARFIEVGKPIARGSGCFGILDRQQERQETNDH